MDPRSPLVISTHDLGRRPGALRELASTVPAPADMGTEVIGAPAGSDMDLDLRLEAVSDGVLVTGTVGVVLRGECSRCLRELDDELSVAVSELYYYQGKRAELAAEGDEEAEDVPELAGELLDLEPTLRDAVVLALPFRPLCRPDCPGLCPECGIRLDDAEPGHHHEQLDPRWSALGSLFPDTEKQAEQ
ncbi:YceD family protein [Georgenia thermotolerans]|uniref:DUF177 domain-containing protein n=1 Tax=Georgenia thermotolerans TaxID=527326 RepID=A0A7J5URA8_9MICO|nr:DUF177 domain-containing protein [Georgenia thermotolerans]KAE8764413.1 DUF177 domain-containing protein [Georgenia thermotolerans]